MRNHSMRWIYSFGDGAADGGREDIHLLGGKGANLGEMTRIGLPVPPGFTITTEACRHFLRDGVVPPDLNQEVDEALARLEERTGQGFGHGTPPLLVSVRSGAAASMPGMMDTILDLGLRESTVPLLEQATGNARFAWDCYRRLIQMYGEVVVGVDPAAFGSLLRGAKEQSGAVSDAELGAEYLATLTSEFKALIQEVAGQPFPEDPRDQLMGAVIGVFRSWNNNRARAYRRVHGIAHDLGTAVSVQAMVFGNLGPDSGSGVAFTRNPVTGEAALYGEFLPNAQGEDVVAGIRDPLPVKDMPDWLPEAYAELERVRCVLEDHFHDMQDLEFTVQRGRVYMLQTRTGKRTAAAALKIAVDMVEEGRIDRKEALTRLDPAAIDHLLHPTVDPEAEEPILASGLPASPGAAVGRVVFTAARAQAWADAGDDVILVREETSPDDFEGMMAARGVLTVRGGTTSHAAVVARGVGKCCVVGVSSLKVEEDEGRMSVGDVVVAEGDWITLDGSEGHVYRGRVPTVEPEFSADFARFMEWADDVRRLRVRANADTPKDSARALENGAEGIGLCRTEHMFFQGERVHVMQEMILAHDEETRRDALDRLLPMQREDFEGIFRVMAGRPVTIRLLDPPLHEFLPRTEAEIADLAERLDVDVVKLRREVQRLRESNPMLGHRGVRLATTFPEIAEMQVWAILEAALTVSGEGVEVIPEIMIPLVVSARELQGQREIVDRVARAVFDKVGREIDYLVGTMIELPRAAMTAGDIALHADFFSFGTN
ncbi:MAG TPA: pyruvate, phosphate dikinase, partial [Longimicrobiales bacterium]